MQFLLILWCNVPVYYPLGIAQIWSTKSLYFSPSFMIISLLKKYGYT